MRLKTINTQTLILTVALVGGILLGSLGFGIATAGIPAPEYPTNEYGETYGSALYATSPETEPNLVLAIGEGGAVGYVRATDLNGPMPKTPEEALQQMMSNAGKQRRIPMYDIDGRTVIGVFVISGGDVIEKTN